MHEITRLIDCLALHSGLAPSTVGRKASGDGQLYTRLANGGEITVGRAARLTQWLSDHWPADLAWPDGIVRPAPSPGSPAAGRREERGAKDAALPAGGGGPLAVARREVAAMRRCMRADPPDHAGAQRHERLALAAARTLGPDGRVCRRAVCEALRVEAHVFDSTVRRYRAGAPVAPRRGGKPEQVLQLLVEAGDVRFRPRTAV